MSRKRGSINATESKVELQNCRVGVVVCMKRRRDGERRDGKRGERVKSFQSVVQISTIAEWSLERSGGGREGTSSSCSSRSP
jgi:hypothetical protein